MIGGIIVFIVLAFLLIRLPVVQDYLTSKADSYLSEKLNTKLSLGAVHLAWPKSIAFKKCYIEDQSTDSLAYFDELNVDIDFFALLQSHVEINSLNVNNAYINISRTSSGSLFNFAFLSEAFSVDTSSISTQSKWTINLAELSLCNARFHIDDKKDSLIIDARVASLNVETLGLDPLSDLFSDVKCSVDKIDFTYTSPQRNIHLFNKELKVELNQLNFMEKITEINSISIDSAIFSYHIKTLPVIRETEVASMADYLNIPWSFKADKFEVNDLGFNYQNILSLVDVDGFDPNNVSIHNFNTRMDSLSFNKDSFSLNVKSMSASEDKGLKLSSISGSMNLSKTNFELLDADIITSNSHIKSNWLFDYKNLDELLSLSKDLGIQQIIEIGKIGYSDFLYFYPDFDTLKFPIQVIDQLNIQSKITGKLNSLDVQEFQLFDSGERALQLSGLIRNAMNIDSSIVDLKLLAETPFFKRLKVFKPEYFMQLSLPEKIEWRSNITRSFDKVTSESKISTSRGELKLNLKFEQFKNKQLYTARIGAKKLNLAYLLDQPDLGIFDFDLALKTDGLNLKNSNTTFTGSLPQFVYKNYSYKDLNFNGKYKNEHLGLDLQLNDPNMQLVLASTIDFNDSVSHSNIILNIINAQLGSVGLVTEEVSLKGSLKINISGFDLNDLNLRLDTEEFYAFKDEKAYSFSQSNINAELRRTSSGLELNTPFFRLNAKADFSANEWKGVFDKIILASVLKDDLSISESKDKNFEFETTYLDPYVIGELFHPDLKELHLNKLYGSYNGTNEKLKIEIDINKILFQDIGIDSLNLIISSLKDDLSFAGFIKKISRGDLVSNSLKVDGLLVGDTSIFHLKVIDGLGEIPISIKSELSTVTGGYQMRIRNDSLRLNYEPWNINSENQLLWANTKLKAQSIYLTQGEQRVSIANEEIDLGSPLVVNFREFRLSSVSRFLDTDRNAIDGVLNGDLILKESGLFNADLQINNFIYKQDTIEAINGMVSNGAYNDYNFLFSIKSKENIINANGNYFLDSDSLSAKIDFSLLDLSALEPYGNGQIENLNGQLKGDVSLLGSSRTPKLMGQLHFVNTNFNTHYLGSYISLKNEIVSFDNEKILFKKFKLRDVLDNEASIDGYIALGLNNTINYNLNINTDRFQVLDKSSNGRNDELFFGKLLVSSSIKVRGDINKPKIDATIKTTAGSLITIVVPQEDLEIRDHDGIVKFLTFNDTVPTIESNVSTQTDTRIALLANLEVDENAILRVLMDREAGDLLEVQGNAQLSYTIDPNGSTNLSGAYEVSRGFYDLTFYNFIKKQFQIDKGSKIIWTGDPYNAQLIAKANYTVSTSALPLIASRLSSDQLSNPVYKQNLPFIVGLNIGGKIASPDIIFTIDLAKNKQNFQGGIVTNKLRQLSFQESELNKQAFSLMLFNRFIAENSITNTSTGLVSNSARNSVSKLLTQQLNSLSDKHIKAFKLNMDLESYENYADGSGDGITDLKLEISKELFNEKLIVTIGGNVGLEGNETQNELRNLAQDIILEYKLDENGIYRLKAFRKNQYDGLIDGDLTKTGAGFTLNKEFENWQNFFKALKLNRQK